MLAIVLQFMFPSLDPLTAWEVRDDGDGPYISAWNNLETQPTENELLTVRQSQAFSEWYAAKRQVKQERQQALKDQTEMRAMVLQRLSTIRDNAGSMDNNQLRAALSDTARILIRIVQALT